MANKPFDVLIVGAGVTGTALLYVLAKYSNVGRIALIEKNCNVAEVNSHPMNNAQTSHDGGTETNYNLEHALKVQAAAKMLRAYVEKTNRPGLFRVTNRMVLAVGEWEIAVLRRRYEEFRHHYPDLRFIGELELCRIEPKVMEGRPPNQPVAALVSDAGYAINYQVLAHCFLSDAQKTGKVHMSFSTEVRDVRREGDMYIVETDHQVLSARVVVFAAGSYSLLFAHNLGYAKHLAILPVAGSFYSGGELLNGKVYRPQIEGMPFAAIHGDPDVLNHADTRFGPTTKPLPLMERHRNQTFWDFIKLPLVSFSGVWKLLKMIHRRRLYLYVLKNVLYDMPWIGPRMFVKEARVIVPTITHEDLKLRRGVGGIRPQIFNMETGDLEMGDSSIDGDNVIFNTTPSPGASICLSNAERDAKKVVAFLGSDYSFDDERLRHDLGLTDTTV